MSQVADHYASQMANHVDPFITSGVVPEPRKRPEVDIQLEGINNIIAGLETRISILETCLSSILRPGSKPSDTAVTPHAMTCTLAMSLEDINHHLHTLEVQLVDIMSRIEVSYD
jgi:hypothetical protein